MAQSLAWGIIGTGSIAHKFANGVLGSKTGKLVAVGSRSQASADKFGDEFKIPASGRHASYESLLADSSVQAVYISTPHPLHMQWAVLAAEAGKHVLCEKPVGLNFAEAMTIVEAARANNVFLMEAFMYRCHPQTQKLVELLREKVIGDVRVIQATFSFHWPRPFNDTSRLTNNALGGGGILDVGCYPASMSRLIAGAALGLDGPAEPLQVHAVGRVGTTGVDEWTVAAVKFPGDIVATLATGVQVGQENVVRIFGSDGSIFIPSPWFCADADGKGRIIVNRNGEKEPRIVTVESDRSLYALEADTVAQFIEKRQAAFPAMSWNDTLGNMKTLDAWRASLGQVYNAEKLDNIKTAVPRPVKPKPNAPMTYGQIPGLDKKVARLAVGADFSGAQPREAFMIFDDYVERGGNMFDTAFIYGGPTSGADISLGKWVKSRGVRKDVIILGKGAHTPYCNPKDLTTQLYGSLERLGVDHLDIYMLHRDNPDIPVSEFIDVLNEHQKAGRFKIFGGSNWSIQRVQAANEYARSKGLMGFSALSNNFSLARMIDPVWAGCISASDADSRAWLTQNQIALIPWSSQARGFFTDRAGRDKTSDAELVRCWYSDDNFERKTRAEQLARKYGVEPINIALAYVLRQPFPTFPLIGPRQISETVSSFGALKVQLTADEVKWLNLDAVEALV